MSAICPVRKTRLRGAEIRPPVNLDCISRVENIFRLSSNQFPKAHSIVLINYPLGSALESVRKMKEHGFFPIRKIVGRDGRMQMYSKHNAIIFFNVGVLQQRGFFPLNKIVDKITGQLGLSSVEGTLLFFSDIR